MDISIVPALAGLTGAAIGGLTSGVASWFAQKTQSRVQLLAQDKVPRQELYKEFIEAATQCYADALQQLTACRTGLHPQFEARRAIMRSPNYTC